MKAPRVTASLERPSWISARAQIVVKGENEASRWGEALRGDRRLAQLTWSPEGRLLYEKPFDAEGGVHGIEIERSDSGEVVWCARWVHGVMHGPAMQFDERGRPVVVTRFEHGRGTDIWMSGGKVTEVREMAEGVPHGLVRWGAPRRPWEEGHFSRGERHGIFREWESDGSLRAGFPRYYVRDTPVPRHQYELERAKDGSLPQYRARDDANRRPMPPSVRDALDRARCLRSERALVERAQRATVIRGNDSTRET
jgi:hypothetical protein